jgi:hypothetical protein
MGLYHGTRRRPDHLCHGGLFGVGAGEGQDESCFSPAGLDGGYPLRWTRSHVCRAEEGGCVKPVARLAFRYTKFDFKLRDCAQAGRGRCE